MIADNIDNLESTLSGSGSSHRVNSILVTTKATEINREMEEDYEYQCLAKRKCRRSLPPEAISVKFVIIMEENVSVLESSLK